MKLPSVEHKVAYVKAQSQTRQHHCHWPGCDRQVPPAVWGCRPHWYTLPIQLRNRIWAAYRPGQEVDGRPDRSYLDAAEAVQAWIALHLTNNPAPAPAPQQGGLF